MASIGLPTRVFVSACAATRLTNVAARFLGAAAFLPRLFVLRYANMGGLDPTEFARQVDAARSFRDDRWCAHWDGIASTHAARATALLRDLAGPDRPMVPDLRRPGTITDDDVATLARLISPAAVTFADHGPQPDDAAITDLVDPSPTSGETLRRAMAFRAIDAWVKAITYHQVSAFPGHAPGRLRAYWRSRELFDALIWSLAPAIGVTVEHVDVAAADGSTVRGWLVLPNDRGPHPVVLTTNGLEGTVQELAIGLMRYRATGMAMFLMEMPGSYAYPSPMSGDSETIYRRVIDRLVADPRLGRIAMVGVSFGGYWAARLAATDDRLVCAVACGAPTHHTFHGGALGIPEVIIGALADTVGARHPMDLVRRLKALSIRDRYADITIPLLAINGNQDTLLSTQDTVDLAAGAPNATLVLYPDDDHCAMGHYRQWLDLSQAWLADRLVG